VVVGLLLGTGRGQRAAAAAAARLAGARSERGLAVFLPRPYIASQTVCQAGYDLRRYTLDLELSQRARASELLGEVGIETRFSLFNIRWPALWRGARLAAELECETLVMAGLGPAASGPSRRLCERRYGLPILSVARG
jgi:hypothetical protein